MKEAEAPARHHGRGGAQAQDRQTTPSVRVASRQTGPGSSNADDWPAGTGRRNKQEDSLQKTEASTQKTEECLLKSYNSLKPC